MHKIQGFKLEIQGVPLASGSGSIQRVGPRLEKGKFPGAGSPSVGTVSFSRSKGTCVARSLHL